MNLKRKCANCNKVKLIHVDKKPPICDDCLEKIKHEKQYYLKLTILIIIILLIFIMSLLIK